MYENCNFNNLLGKINTFLSTTKYLLVDCFSTRLLNINSSISCKVYEKFWRLEYQQIKKQFKFLKHKIITRL